MDLFLALDVSNGAQWIGVQRARRRGSHNNRVMLFGGSFVCDCAFLVFTRLHYSIPLQQNRRRNVFGQACAFDSKSGAS